MSHSVSAATPKAPAERAASVDAGWSDAGWRPSVWAPDATALVLVTGGSRWPMHSSKNGWWHSDRHLPHGTDYAFSVDEGEARPDPRSAWQPEGVHASSRVFDARRYPWQSTTWAGRDARGAVTMELHIGTFTPDGTLDAAIERLDHLAALGIDMIELMPMAAFAGEHGWGYDGVALFAVHAPYGGPAALQRFVDAAHARDMAVCLDVVYNHLGPSGNYLGQFGPYFTDRHATPWGAAINLDGEGADEVRRWIIDNACRWCRDFGIDALRLDAVHALMDESPTHLLAELSAAIATLSTELERPLSLIAESDLNDPRMVEPLERDGRGMTMQWADDVHHAINATMTGERHGYYVDFGSLAVLKKALTGAFVHDGTYSSFREKFWGHPVPRDMDGQRFVAFYSDHDQTGNRALGDRPATRHADDGSGVAISAALVLTSAFTPMLFMGDEWGAGTPWQFFTDHQEPELADAIRRGRAREFAGHGWENLYGQSINVPDPQDPQTFLNSKLDWQELKHGPSQRLLEWHRTLIALRREEPALSCGDLNAVSVEHDDQEGGLIVSRQALRVVIVLSDSPRTFSLGPLASVTPLALWGQPPIELNRDGTLTAPGRSVTILRGAQGSR